MTQQPRAISTSASICIGCACTLLSAFAPSVDAAQFDIIGPAGSGTFGSAVTVLPNGNIVVVDPSASVPAANAVRCTCTAPPAC